MTIDLKPEDINRTIAEAIAKSAIGDQLERIIKEKVVQVSKSYDNPLDAAVSKMINELLYSIINEKFKPIIRAKVVETVTDEMVSKLFMRMWESFERSWR